MMAFALATTLRRPFVWWLGQWRMSLPQELRLERDRQVGTRVVVAVENGRFAFRLLDRRGARAVRPVDEAPEAARQTLDTLAARRSWLGGKGRLALSFQASNAVMGTLKIPAQARSREADIVADQVSRRTPFRRDELVVGYRSTVGRAGTAELLYAALPKARLDAAVAPVGLRAEDFDGFDVPGEGGEGTRFLPVRAPVSGAGSAGVRIVLALLAAGVLAGTLGTGALAWRQHRVLLDLERRIAATVPAVREESARLREVYRLAEGIASARELRASIGVVQVWESLAAMLPDSAYLTAFEISGNELLANGYAQAAPDLIRHFEGLGALHGAAFTGPVVQDPQTGKEQFSIRAMLHRPRAPGEDEP